MPYKHAVLILAFIVTISQIVRICIVGFEIRPVRQEFQEIEPSTLMFCIWSIGLGLASLFLEGLLVYSVKRNNLHGIQPYFLCTLFIFLISLLGTILTFSIYIINPIDHNNKVPKRIEDFLKNKSLTLQNYNSTSKPDITNFTSLPELLLQDDIKFDLDISNTSSLTIQVIKFNDTIRDIKLNTTSKILMPEEHEVKQKWNAIKVNGNDTSTQANNSSSRTGRKFISIAEKKHTHQHKKHQSMQLLKYYQVRPVLTLSYLIDLVRCLPQLYFVNRFVKTEKLHTHLVSHPSFSALYVVKHV